MTVRKRAFVGTINGDKILELRKARGWEQQDLADAANVARSVISRMERSIQSDFQVSVLISVASAFGVSTDSLLMPEYQQEQPTIAPELQSAVSQLSERPTAVQKLAASVLTGLLNGLDDSDETKP